MYSHTQNSNYSCEMVDEFLRLTAGGAPLTTIEIDEETYDYITLLADHWKMTRRQAFTKIMKTATDKVLNEQPCTCDGWLTVCNRPACQEMLEEECAREDQKSLNVALGYWAGKYLPYESAERFNCGPLDEPVD